MLVLVLSDVMWMRFPLALPGARVDRRPAVERIDGGVVEFFCPGAIAARRLAKVTRTVGVGYWIVQERVRRKTPVPQGDRGFSGAAGRVPQAYRESGLTPTTALVEV
ncbi:hypothetical protein GCM10027020_32260 [Nocardioides salsibiostraticola]